MWIESTETLNWLDLEPEMIALVFSSLSLSLFAVTHAFTFRKHSWTVWTAVRADVESGWKGRYSSESSAKSFQQVSQFFVLLPSVKGEEDGTQHTAPRTSIRQRSVFRKRLVYCDMLGSVSQVWTKPLVISTGNAHLIIQPHHHHHHHHQSLNREGRWVTTDDFATSFLHFSLFSTALWELPNSRPVHSLMLSSHLFLSPPCLLPPFTVPCKMVLARPDERETWPYHCSVRLFTIVRRSCGQIACWILARTSSLVTWSLYETCSILR